METNQVARIFPTTDKAPAKTKSEQTTDGFANFAAKLGITPLGQVPSTNNLLSHGHYQFNLVTRNRVALEAAYRGSWIVGRVIDTKAKDMIRAGINITTNEDPENVEKVQHALKRLKIWSSTRETIQWGDLYGGACGVMQIEGQDLESPLDPDTVGEGQFKGLVVYDRWQLYPVLDKLINEGPDLGLPEFYDIVLGSNLNDPGQEPGGQVTENANGRIRVHHSRCLRMIGIKLPFWQAITEMLWGESVLERMWDRLIAFDDATMSTGNLIARAQLRTIGIDGLREILAAGGEAQEALVKQFQYMAEFQNNEGVTLLDKEDTFASTAYSFAGLSDVMIQFGQQVSGSAEIPLVALFGQSPAGMNATGDSDIRLYYDGINGKQESDLRPFLEVLLKIVWRSEIGEEPPKDLAFTFVPLWQVSATEKATIAKTNTDTVIEAHQEGLVDTQTAMKELKQASGETGLFSNITDEQIEEAENEEPPAPEAIASAGNEPGVGTGNPAAGPTKPKDKMSLKEQLTGVDRAKDSAWGKIKKLFTKDRGVEATIKEFEKGTLKSSSGKKVTSKKQALAIGYSEQGEDSKVSDAQKIKDWLRKQK